MRFNGSEIRRLRKEKKWSVKPLAEALGYTNSQSLNNIESEILDEKGKPKQMAPNKERLLVGILKLTEDEIKSLTKKNNE